MTTLAATLAASLPAPVSSSAPAPSPVDTIPASMAKVVDIEAEIRLTTVQLDGLVVLKILKHSRETAPASASGLLLGLDLDGTLEVSNSFPLPITADDEDKPLKTAGGRYEASMLRQLKEVHADDNVVGFYQSSSMDAFFTKSLVATQASDQDKLRHGGVVLVHDVAQTARGNAGLRAFRLSSAFMSAHGKRKFNTQSLIDNRLTFSAILEELPIQIRNSVLLNAFLKSFTQSPPKSLSSSVFSSPTLPSSFSSLNLTSASTLTRNMESLIDTLDAYKTEESSVAYLSRQIAREKARAEAHVVKRREDNTTRVAQGLPPLPEEDVSRLFKISPEPSRLDSMLLLGQLDGYSKNLAEVTSAELVKMYAAKSGST